MRGSRCAHCGLPLRETVLSPSYCCHACSLGAALVGQHREGGGTSWHLLRLGTGTLLAMNIMTLSLLLYGGSIDPASIQPFRFLLLVLSAAALTTLLPPFVSGSIREVAGGRLNMNLLIATGSLAAFGVSAAHTIRGVGAIYYDTATMLPVLVTIGTFIESGARGQASDLLKSLETLLPKTALRMVDQGTEEVDLGQLRAGDLVRVLPGQRMAVDGTIEEGITEVFEALFTGECLPRPCGPGDRVVAGTVNGTGPILVRADATGDLLLVARIVAMVETAWRQPTGYERLADRVAARFIPLVITLSAGVLTGWWLMGDPGRGGVAALSVLVVACPCTFGIATPLATCLGMLRAAKSGVIVRNSRTMELAAAVREICFDKTGTITCGCPEVGAIIPADGTCTDELLGRLAALESVSEHPVARAILAAAEAHKCDTGVAGDCEVHPGKGISGMVSWQGQTLRVLAGTPEFAGGAAGDGPDEECRATLVDVSWGGTHRGRVQLIDRVRGDAAAAVAALRNLGIESRIASGDRHGATRRAAAEAGIDRVEAPCPPDRKLNRIRSSMAAGGRTAMVGDGVNDAPALAAADVGIAMGGGADLARAAGNVFMLSDRLALIPWLFSLSRATVGIVRQNLFWSLTYNGVALAAAAAGFLHPLLAAAAMVVSSITVLGNSLRIMRFPECVGSYPETSLPTENAGPSSGPIP